MMTIPTFLFDYSLIIIILFYILFVINGIKKGFLYIFLDIVGFIIALVGAYYLTPTFSDAIMLVPASLFSTDILFHEPLKLLFNNIFLFFIIFMLLFLCINILKKVFITVSSLPIIGTVNKFLGGILGIIIGTFWIILISIALKTPLFTNGNDFVNQTALSNISGVSDQTLNFIFTNYLTDEKIISLVTDANKNNSNENIITIIEKYYSDDQVSDDQTKSDIFKLLNSDNCNIILSKLQDDEEFNKLVENNSDVDLNTLFNNLKGDQCDNLSQNQEFVTLINNPEIAAYLHNYLIDNVNGGE